jgi:hypothetical protein
MSIRDGCNVVWFEKTSFCTLPDNTLPIATKSTCPKLKCSYFCSRTTRISLLGVLNDHLDSLAGVDVLEGLLSILELDTACDKLLHADAAGCDEIKSQLVVAGSVSE